MAGTFKTAKWQSPLCLELLELSLPFCDRNLVDAINSLKIGKTEVETLTSTFDQSHAGLTFGISLKLHVILPQRLKGKTIDLKPILVKPRGSYNPGQNVLRHLEHEARKHTLLIKSVFNLL